MNIFITGLCLQGNKGGPAIALSLMQQLAPYLKNSRYIFSVPGKHIEYEKQWAQKYGVDVVASFGRSSIIPSFSFKTRNSGSLISWVSALRQADVVIEMSAISYVGPPCYPKSKRPFSDIRFYYFLASKLFRKPFFSWTQSYGPFSTWDLQFQARYDLGGQPIVFCRGDDSLNMVKELLPHQKVYSFPDVAISLDYEKSFGMEYLQSLCGDIKKRKVITISPSAVIYSKDKEHANFLGVLCQKLNQQGYTIVFVPHTLRIGSVDPCWCDSYLSKKIREDFDLDMDTYLVTEDLSATELKSIISCAYVHIGGRYHSIIAALSSGVPCLSLAWHHKYIDIMRMYGLEEFVHNSHRGDSIESCWQLFLKIVTSREDYVLTLQNAQNSLLTKLDENVELFINLLKKHI